MKTVAAFAFAMLGLSPLVASADGPWYVGVGVGESNLDFRPVDDSATGWKVFGGNQFHDNFAAEVGYLDSGDIEETVGTDTFEASTTGATASVIGSLPIGDTFSVHARVGVYFWDAEADLDDGAGTVISFSDGGEELFYGVGGAMKLGEGAALRLEYEIADISPDFSDVDVSTISLSELYKF